MWLKIGADGWLSSTRKRISWFYTMRGFSVLVKKPVASLARLRSMALEFLVEQFN